MPTLTQVRNTTLSDCKTNLYITVVTKRNPDTNTYPDISQIYSPDIWFWFVVFVCANMILWSCCDLRIRISYASCLKHIVFLERNFFKYSSFLYRNMKEKDVSWLKHSSCLKSDSTIINWFSIIKDDSS